MTLKDLLKAYVQAPLEKDPEDVLVIGDPTPIFVFIVDDADRIQAVRRFRITDTIATTLRNMTVKRFWVDCKGSVYIYVYQPKE